MEFSRLFTRQEAEGALPLVRQIVADILRASRRMKEVGENNLDFPRLQQELEENLRELVDMGCYFRDWNFSVGLVDFPTIIDGQTVFLCWRGDEEDLAWYHGIEDGYQGRKPLPKS